MIKQLMHVPPHVVAFEATGDVTKDDFINTVHPAVQKAIKETDELNYLLVLKTDIANFTAGAWWQDAVLGIKHLSKWRRAAIVTDNKNIQTFTTIFSALMPGEFKGFDHEKLQEAIDWIAVHDNK